MYRKHQKPGRWNRGPSPKREESRLFKSHLRDLRRLLDDDPLPPGLPKATYLAKHTERLARFEERFRLLLLDSQAALNQEDGALLATSQHLLEVALQPQVLVVSEEVWRRLLVECGREPNRLRELGSRQFEELVAFLFGEFGYDVELTQKTRDGGRDIIAIRHGEVHCRYLIECKHPVTGAKIGVRPVRELYAVKVDEGATKAILATTSEFTRDAQIFWRDIVGS